MAELPHRKPDLTLTGTLFGTRWTLDYWRPSWTRRKGR